VANFSNTTPAATSGKTLVEFQADGQGNISAQFATPVSATPGGANGDIQYNNSGAFGGFADGTSHQLLHGGKTFGAVALASEVSGLLPLANGGTNVDLSASGGATFVLAQDGSHVISARALIAADIPNLDASKITTGALALARGGTAVDLSASGSSTAFLAQDASHVISARAIVTGDLPTGYAWSKLGNAAADLTLANAAFNTTFGQTSASAVWKWVNTTSATTSTAVNSPLLKISGGYFQNNATASDDWVFQNLLTTPIVQTITNVSETSGSVVTLALTALGAGLGFAANDVVTFSGLTTATWLNGVTVTITSVAGTGTTSIVFTDPTGHGTQALHAETGTVTQVNINAVLSISHSGVAGNTIHAISGIGTFTSQQNGVMVPNLYLSGSGSGIIQTQGTGTGAPGTNVYGWFPGVAQGSLTVNCRNNSAQMFVLNALNVAQFIINSPGTIARINSIATVGAGVPAEYATVDATAQSAAIAATTLYAVPATTGVGMYRVSFVATITTASTSGGIIGGANGFQIIYTDSTDSVVKTSAVDARSISAANTTATTVSGSYIAYCKASTNLQYKFDYTAGTGTALVYNLHVKVEYLG
jgi:hypothetical protein